MNFDKVFEHVKSTVSENDQAKAAMNVIKRTIPINYNQFTIKIDFNFDRNKFRLVSNSTNVEIIASSGTTACRGFYYFLKYHCKSHISWEGSQITIPSILPKILIEKQSKSLFIYYQNVCTWSYSFPWWKWSDWQRHIDWMALSGVTMVLAPVQEKIWTNIYRRLNMTQMEIDEHLSGPAFFAWQRMGNIRGLGGPLSENFKRLSSDLQKRIIFAVRELGMVVALPGFAGHVPMAFQRIFPNSTFTPVDRWNKFTNKFCCPLYVDPTDSLFTYIGEMFLTEIIKEYGTNHIYFSDPFNEIQPKLAEGKYLRDAAQSIYSAMKSVDNQSIWLLQGWMLVKNPFWSDELIEAFLTANPIGSMLILDLQSEQHPQYERTKSFYGQPFIWCMLHNFGGTLGLHGSFQIINERVLEAQNMVNSTMVGFGITPEGINQNYVLYEFALEMGWFRERQDFKKWFTTYTTARYGQSSDSMVDGWLELVSSVYSFNGTEQMRGKYTFNRRPSLKIQPWVSHLH